jgi:hypothetical protein
MAQNFAKYAGIIQLLIGALGQFVPGIGSMLGAQTGGNMFNMLSGAALGYLGMKGSEGAAQTGAKVVGGLNGLVGLLGALGINNKCVSTEGWGDARLRVSFLTLAS